MRSERVFLMELFLDDEVPKKIKLLIKDRIAELEQPEQQYAPMQINVPDRLFSKMGHDLEASILSQSPSMQRIMAQNPDLLPKPPTPVTPQAAQALAQRQALINGAGKEKPEDGRRSPRKI